MREEGRSASSGCEILQSRLDDTVYNARAEQQASSCNHRNRHGLRQSATKSDCTPLACRHDFVAQLSIKVAANSQNAQVKLKEAMSSLTKACSHDSGLRPITKSEASACTKSRDFARARVWRKLYRSISRHQSDHQSLYAPPPCLTSILRPIASKIRSAAASDAGHAKAPLSCPLYIAAISRRDHILTLDHALPASRVLVTSRVHSGSAGWPYSDFD